MSADTAITSRLDGLDPAARQREAGAAVMELDEGQIAALAPATRLMLAEAIVNIGPGAPCLRPMALGKGHFPDPIALAHLYEAQALDPAGQAHLAALEQKALAALSTALDLKALAAGWRGLGRGERAAHLQKASDAVAAAFGCPKAEFKVILFAGVGPAALAGRYDPRQARIDINAQAEAGFDDLRTILNRTLHETRHHIQACLVKEYESGRIGPDHALATQLRWFRLNFADHGDLGLMPHETYCAQPLERDAMAFGDRMAAAACRPRAPAPAPRARPTAPLPGKT